MKRYIRLVIILVVSLVAYCSLCGFMYDSPNFNVDICYENDDKINESFEKDKIFDILVPFDESDEWYTDFNELETEIPKDSELANYSEDGYRSLRCHFRDTVGGRKSVNISKEWGGDKKRSGSARHALFCHRYKKCRVAIADKNGNIITVSETAKLEENFVIMVQSRLKYNPETNELSASYTISKIAQGCIEKSVIILVMSNVFAIILLLIYLTINKLRKYCRVFLILSSLFWILLILIAIIGLLLLSSGNGTNLSGILSGLYDFGVIVIYSGFSVLVFIAFCTEYKKLKASKEEITTADVGIDNL